MVEGVGPFSFSFPVLEEVGKLFEPSIGQGEEFFGSPAVWSASLVGGKFFEDVLEVAGGEGWEGSTVEGSVCVAACPVTMPECRGGSEPFGECVSTLWVIGLELGEVRVNSGSLYPLEELTTSSGALLVDVLFPLRAALDAGRKMPFVQQARFSFCKRGGPAEFLLEAHDFELVAGGVLL